MKISISGPAVAIIIGAIALIGGIFAAYMKAGPLLYVPLILGGIFLLVVGITSSC